MFSVCASGCNGWMSLLLCASVCVCVCVCVCVFVCACVQYVGSINSHDSYDKINTMHPMLVGIIHNLWLVFSV